MLKDRAWYGITRRMLQSRKTLLLILILVLGLIFFVHNAHLQLATDDIGWLQGEAPTVFDQYRVIPRVLFVSLYLLFGPSPVAALVMIFLFHTLNTILVYDLAGKLFQNATASIVSAFVFAINPLTLSTLTWISCFSYILGTTLVLLSIEAFLKGMATTRYWLWWACALGLYIMGLFCSHEIFFFPVLFLLLSWLTGKAWLKPGLALCVLSMSLALLIFWFVYNFRRFGVDNTQLFHWRFISAYLSSALSLGFSLGLAYPLSFFVHPTAFLQFSFNETVRWGITLALLISGIVLFKPTSKWRIGLFLTLACTALITPYIVRFALMPKGVNYDISYILTGRVFYLPFFIIALFWGKLCADIYETHLKHKSWGKTIILVPLGAYFYALWFLYGPEDFMGLAVIQEGTLNFPPPWNPYQGDHPVWLASLGLIGIMIGYKLVRAKRI